MGYVHTGPYHIQFSSVPIIDILFYDLVGFLSREFCLVVLVQLKMDICHQHQQSRLLNLGKRLVFLCLVQQFGDYARCALSVASTKAQTSPAVARIGIGAPIL